MKAIQMHGMINRGLESFVRRIYGANVWRDVCTFSDLSVHSFEAMLYYDDLITETILDTVGELKNIARADLLEDFGTFIVSEHSSPRVRKLLRLGGETYEEFLYSLEDLQDRVGLAVPDLDLPLLTLEVCSSRKFVVHSESAKIGYGPISLGILRAIADSYESFVVIKHSVKVKEDISIDRFQIEIMEQVMPDTHVQMSEAS